MDHTAERRLDCSVILGEVVGREASDIAVEGSLARSD
jgi:6-phosphofructokinase